MQHREAFDCERFDELARTLRHKVMEMIGAAGSGHVGGCMSVVEILLTLYHRILTIRPDDPLWDERDRFVMSKGHAGPALYVVLARLGYFPEEDLMTLNANGTRLPSHCDRLRTVGIDMTTGSLGQGFSAAIGMALGLRLRRVPSTVWTLIGCGECNEGQIWEAAMSAGKYGLGNLVAITDYNRLQIDGTNDDVMPLEPLTDKWRAFGWECVETDGHDWEALYDTFRTAETVIDKPTMIICHTVKGKGISFAEGQVSSHNIKMNDKLLQKALQDLSPSNTYAREAAQ